MSSFTTPLVLEYLDGRTWRVAEEFVYHIGAEGSGMAIHVPKGFETDFASVPRVFWRVLPPTGDYGKAAVIHDKLYKDGSGNREWCDGVFLEAMTVLGVSLIKRQIIYRAVRLFGWIAWNAHRRNQKSK